MKYILQSRLHTVCRIQMECLAGCTFDIVAYTIERAGVPTALWVEEDTSSSDEAGSLSTLIPIKSTSLANGTLKVQLHAETP